MLKHIKDKDIKDDNIYSIKRIFRQNIKKKKKKKKDNFLYKFTVTVSKIFLSQPVVSIMVEQFTCRQLKKLLQ